MTATELGKVAEIGDRIESGAPCKVVVGGKVYKVKQVTTWVRTQIDNLAKEALFLERAAQKEMTLKRAKKLNRRIRAIHAKQAAYFLLGEWSRIRPLYALTWRRLEAKTSEVTFAINNAGLNDEDLGFFLLGWQLTRSQLGAFTNLIGESEKQKQEREESAESMLETDASPKKAEGSK